MLKAEMYVKASYSPSTVDGLVSFSYFVVLCSINLYFSNTW